MSAASDSRTFCAENSAIFDFSLLYMFTPLAQSISLTTLAKVIQKSKIS